MTMAHLLDDRQLKECRSRRPFINAGLWAYLSEEVTGREGVQPLIHGQALSVGTRVLAAKGTWEDPVLHLLPHVGAEAVTTERVQAWQRAGLAHLLQTQRAREDVLHQLAHAGHCGCIANDMMNSMRDRDVTNFCCFIIYLLRTFVLV